MPRTSATEQSSRHCSQQLQLFAAQVRGQAQLRIDPGFSLLQLQAQARLAQTGAEARRRDGLLRLQVERLDALPGQLLEHLRRLRQFLWQ